MQDSQYPVTLLTRKGRINLHRTQAPAGQTEQNHAYLPPQPWNRFTAGSSNSSPSWRSPRVAPYTTGRGRAGRIVANPHRNRTLVLNNKAGVKEPGSDAAQPGPEDVKAENEGNEPTQSPAGWVTKRDRHMQLINSSIYDKETQVRNKAIEETRRQKTLRRDEREKQKIQRHLKTLSPHQSQNVATPTAYELAINGLRFQVLDGGSKLARIRSEASNDSIHRHLSSQHTDAADSASTTPKQANVGGVTFLRSKNGNLYRLGIVKAKR